MRLVPLKKETQENLLCLFLCSHPCERPQEEGHLQIRKEVLTRPRICECLVLGLPASRIRRNKCLSCKPPRLWYVVIAAQTEMISLLILALLGLCMLLFHSWHLKDPLESLSETLLADWKLQDPGPGVQELGWGTRLVCSGLGLGGFQRLWICRAETGKVPENQDGSSPY